MKISSLLNRFLVAIKSSLSTSHRIGQITLDTPRGFVLGKYQHKHKLYDRFLPVLASCLPENGLVVDVGANIGDTTLAMIQEKNNRYFCYEPSAHFFGFLTKNIAKLPAQSASRVQAFPLFVGTGEHNGTLVYSHEGTARLDTSQQSNAMTFHPLDKLLEQESDIALIKSDTDGFDFDVLRSGLQIMENHQPLLFWENEIYNEDQFVGYQKLLDALERLSYTHLYIFDNYGGLLLEDVGVDALKQLCHYMYHAKFGGGSQTFYYVDVLAATDRHNATAQAAIAAYKKQYQIH
jgi:FkbM family methyltransferase